tara:strand:+ start:1891 stop:2877 length:987 start_codon:yes stop_codon:yes gene_type:complete
MPKRQAQLQDWLKKILPSKRFSLNQISGDASFRRYFRLIFEDKSTVIAVDAPPEKENCEVFLDITERLNSINVRVPKILQYNLNDGFMIIEDFGDDLYLQHLNETTADSLYEDAINEIIKIQYYGNTENLPSFGSKIATEEIGLFINWFLKKHLKLIFEKDDEIFFKKCAEDLNSNIEAQPKFFMHRDFHSRNLFISQKRGPGIIDYQDAAIGPISYDLVSLLRDCYISWPEEKVQFWINDYKNKAKEAKLLNSHEFDVFDEWFDLMGIQRHLKAIGIFSRLYYRDGKGDYLKDIPRVLEYVLNISNKWEKLKGLNIFLEKNVFPKLK